MMNGTKQRINPKWNDVSMLIESLSTTSLKVKSSVKVNWTGFLSSATTVGLLMTPITVIVSNLGSLALVAYF